MDRADQTIQAALAGRDAEDLNAAARDELDEFLGAVEYEGDLGGALDAGWGESDIDDAPDLLKTVLGYAERAFFDYRNWAETFDRLAQEALGRNA